MIWIKDNVHNHSMVRAKPFTWSLYFLFGIWHLWLLRNKTIFQSSPHNPLLVTTVESVALEFVYCIQNPSTPKRSILIPVRWERPNSCWFKLNTNGSALKYPGLAGGGGLIRNSSGSWVKGFARKIGIKDSVAAELWALRDGLTLCINLCLSLVEIELDAKELLTL